MKRKEYMDKLEQFLDKLPLEEREEALQFYNDYFDDAGVENEDKVIQELGTPEEVAEKIKRGYTGEYASYSEQGFEDSRFKNTQEITTDRQEDVTEEEKKEKRNSDNKNLGKILALIFLVLLGIPVILPLGAAIIIVIIALIIALAALIFGIGVSGIAIFISGIAVIIAGIAKMVFHPATGILAAGIGCILLAVGILLTWAVIAATVKVLPACIRFVVRILQTPFRKAGVR